MKKLTLLLLSLTLFAFVKAQTPIVEIAINDTTTTTVNASFTKNADCIGYSILMGVDAEMQNFTVMFGVPMEALIEQWGIHCTGDTTYTWTSMTPNTEYTVYALAKGANDSILYTTITHTTGSGGTGVSEVTIELSEITNNSVRMICTPNSNTAVFYDGIIKKAIADSIGIDSTISAFLQANQNYPQYGVDNWVWTNLDSATAFYAISLGKNSLDEWGDTTMVEFSTLGDIINVENIDKAETVKIYPNPSNGTINYMVNNDFEKVFIYDLKGNIVYSNTISERQGLLNLNILNGTYFIQFAKKGLISKSTKIIIQK